MPYKTVTVTKEVYFSCTRAGPSTAYPNPPCLGDFLAGGGTAADYIAKYGAPLPQGSTKVYTYQTQVYYDEAEPEPPDTIPEADLPDYRGGPTKVEILEAELVKKGYGTLSSVHDGKILNIDNYWRKDGGSTGELPFDWFGKLPNTQAYWQNGFKVHYEDYYQPQNRSPFSPLPDNLYSQEGAYIGLLLFYLATKKPQIFKDLAKTYMQTIGAIIRTIADAGKTHPLASVHASTSLAAILHRAGLITDGGYLKMVDESRNIISVMQQQGTAMLALDGVQTLVEGSKIETRQTKEGGLTETLSGLGLLANIKAVTP